MCMVTVKEDHQEEPIRSSFRLQGLSMPGCMVQMIFWTVQRLRRALHQNFFGLVKNASLLSTAKVLETTVLRRRWPCVLRTSKVSEPWKIFWVQTWFMTDYQSILLILHWEEGRWFLNKPPARNSRKNQSSSRQALPNPGGFKEEGKAWEGRDLLSAIRSTLVAVNIPCPPKQAVQSKPATTPDKNTEASAAS